MPNTTNLMPLRRVVCLITKEADEHDEQSIKKAIKGWHNKLANGSVPRRLFVKIGKQLFLNLNLFEQWIKKQGEHTEGGNHYETET